MLDTDVLIEITKGNTSVKTKLSQFPARFYISSITLAEVLRGSKNKKDFEFISSALAQFHVLHLNENISGIFLRLMKRYALSHNPGIADLLIASTSIYYSVPLYTLNKKNFRFIPGIKLT